MKRKISIIEFAMKYRQIVFLVTTLLVLFGSYAIVKMPRQEFPTFTIRQGLVIGVYPGATSEEVEEQLTDAVEKYLFGYKEIKRNKTYSVSKDGMMVVYVELNDNIKDTDAFWSKLNHGLNNFKSQLPSGVLAIQINNDFGDTSALLITLESKNKSYRELESLLKELENRLRKVESVSKLRHYGMQSEQIAIYLEPEKLTSYGINSSTLLANLYTQGFTTVSGQIENDKIIAPIHISESYSNEEDIASQIIYSDPTGHLIRLKDIARIVREYPDPDSYIKNNGEKCLMISMEMLPGNNIVEYGEKVDQVLNGFLADYPEDISINRIADQPKVVKNSISGFMFDFFFAIFTVILVTMLLLPFKVASVAATSIPITIFASLGIMYATGIELNTVTLAALIVVLGMIVDNSIVIVDSYMEKLDHGVSRWHASISSAKGFFKAILSATLAISITFIPFLYTLTGTLGDFVQMFPWTVCISLGISLLVAMLVIPYMQYAIIKTGFKQTEAPSGKKKRKSLLDIIQSTYEWALKIAFKHSRWTLSIALVSVILGVFIFLQLPQRLMPLAERDQFAIEIYLPQGNSLDITAKISDSLTHILQKDPRVHSVTAFVGTSSPRFHTTYAPNFPAKNYAQLIVNTTSAEATEEILNEYPSKYAWFFPEAYIRFKQLDYQAVAAPIEIRYSGNDLRELELLADSVSSEIRSIKGITWVRTNFEELLPGVRVDIDAGEANRLGINKTVVSANLAAHFNEIPLTTLWERDYPLSVVLKMDKDQKVSFDDIEKEYIHSIVPGVSVPLRQIATVTPDWTQGKIVRRNGVRTITIMADVARDRNVNDVFPSVRKISEQHLQHHKVSLQFGGAKEMDREYLPQMFSALIISMFIVFLILVFHFRKINLALLIMSSIVLTLLGAALGILILHLEIGLTSLLGIVSLVGILVRNGIIMLDYAEMLRIRENYTVREAAIEAGKRRMRPIFLTSAAASMGVISMIVSNSSLWSPMGAIVCFGTMVSMIFIVLVLPVAYWVIFRRVDRIKPTPAVIPVNGTSIAKVIPLVALMIGFTPLMNAQSLYSLEDCKGLALKNNAQIKNARLEIESSQEVSKSAFTRYFPKVEMTALTFAMNDPLIDMKIPGGNLPVYDGNPAHLLTATQFAYFPGMSFSLLDKGILGVVTATQPLYAGGRIRTGNQLSRLGIEVNRRKMALSENEVILKTEEQYWQIISLKEKMKTLMEMEQLLGSFYKQANDAWQAGLINRNDVMKVSLKQSDLRVNKLKLENGILLASMAFCQHLGLPLDTKLELSDQPLPDQTPETLYIDPDQALTNREEYKLLQKSAEAETMQTKLTRGEYLPEAGIGVGALYYDLTDHSTTNAMAFASIKIPLSDWWGAAHTLKERKLKEQITLNNNRNQNELMLLQMQKTWNELNETYQKIQVVEESVTQAEENLKINKDNYEAGIVNISDMLEVQTLLQQAREQLSEAKMNYRIKRITYLQVTAR